MGAGFAFGVGVLSELEATGFLFPRLR
jgi:hypothetical protein